MALSDYFSHRPACFCFLPAFTSSNLCSTREAEYLIIICCIHKSYTAVPLYSCPVGSVVGCNRRCKYSSRGLLLFAIILWASGVTLLIAVFLSAVLMPWSKTRVNHTVSCRQQGVSCSVCVCEWVCACSRWVICRLAALSCFCRGCYGNFVRVLFHWGRSRTHLFYLSRLSQCFFLFFFLSYRLPDGFTQLLNLTQLFLNDAFLEYLPANFGR